MNDSWINLKYDYYSAIDHGQHRHAIDAMYDLGIEFEHSVPQSLIDEYWFFNCSNVPDKLPEYISILQADPRDWITKKD